MTKAQWMKIAAILQARWPHRDIPPESINLWFEDLAEYPAEQVNSAVQAIYQTGREWCPNGAQIRLKLLELARPAHDWGKAWELVNRAASKYGAARGLGWLEENDPIAADAIRRYGWDQFCTDGETPEGTKRAQFRDIFTEVAEGAKRHEQYAGIPPAGLTMLEQAGGAPTRIGDLIQLDQATRQIDAGEEAA